MPVTALEVPVALMGDVVVAAMVEAVVMVVAAVAAELVVLVLVAASTGGVAVSVTLEPAELVTPVSLVAVLPVVECASRSNVRERNPRNEVSVSC